jgi:hypothetical protein
MLLGILIIAAGVIVVFVIVRFVWKLRKDEIELEPGGSWGDQLSDRGDEEKPR